MSIRSNAMARGGDLSPGLQDILRRNGMQAHIIRQGDAYTLAVQGHDSPLLTYNLTANQIKALTDWGTNFANKNAYNTFAAIVADDFDVPKNFVHARNANGRVVMGLHGYRIGAGEYGRPMHQFGRPMPMGPHGMVTGMRQGWHPIDMFHGGFLGWTPRQQPGFHGRRVGGAYFMQGAPFVPERPDGRMKPGELQSGAYGFYYKGQPQTQGIAPKQDVLTDLQTVITPQELRPRPTEPAKPYKELIGSDVYFSNEKWQEVLESHGIVIDAEAKTLTIQSRNVEQDFVYDLKPEEVAKLTNNSIKNAPVQARLDIINALIKDDYADKITMDMLNSKEQIGIDLKPEIKEAVNQEIQRQQEEYVTLDNGEVEVFKEDLPHDVAQVDGNTLYELNSDKAWYREGKHGREVTVDDIRVEPKRNEQGEVMKDKKGETLYRMTAVINGESISHDITSKQYNKFMAIDDYHRMKLFSHIFNEVDMKTIPGHGANIGAMILAGLAVSTEMAHGVGHLVHEVQGIGHHPHYAPDFYEERHGGPKPHVYFKPGVDSPQELAARAFEAGLNAGEHGVGHQR